MLQPAVAYSQVKFLRSAALASLKWAHSQWYKCDGVHLVFSTMLREGTQNAKRAGTALINFSFHLASDA